ncbi:hypothetical protein [Simplicispira metamorpha]|nr:hypothetical protein [Simplicispira metamorpha]
MRSDFLGKKEGGLGDGRATVPYQVSRATPVAHIVVPAAPG